MIIQGKCHCGNISLSLLWEPAPSEIPARACSCSFCTKHRGVWTSKHDGQLQIVVQEPALVSKYEFATRTARFLVCARCGVVPVSVSQIDHRLYAVVNVSALEGVDPVLLRPGQENFDGETIEDRLARRKRRWIADVEYIEGG